MSRIGKQPIPIPSGVTVETRNGEIRVKGPKGDLSEAIPERVDVRVEEGAVVCARRDDRRDSRARHGLARALIANMVQGVSETFAKELEIQGVGYRAEVSGTTLKLLLGFSHPVEMPVPKGLEVSVERNVAIRIAGADRRQVGQFAADLRALRPPEPYKGKGIRYAGEQIRRKVGKAGATS